MFAQPSVEIGPDTDHDTSRMPERGIDKASAPIGVGAQREELLELIDDH